MSERALGVGLVGQGRFGRALAGLLDGAGIAHHAFDAVAAPGQVGSLAELSALAETLIVAVPVPAMGETLEALRPHLGPAHLVMDVGSVKLGPAAELERVMGTAIPWVATHPLFGPASLARAERPLRVIVCPNAQHPQALARARDFWSRLGCELSEQTPEEHDRHMAMTHVLAFFVAKGLLDAGAGENVTFAPPSFQAIARTLEAVRGDAGHLFTAIQRENPFAEEARKKLLGALVGIDHNLESGSDTGVEPAAPPDALTIPDLGARSPELLKTREHIDELDRELVSLLARRAELARRAARAKAQIGAGVLDEGRERSLLQARRAWATSLGLDEAAVEEIFGAVLRFSRGVQGG